jgi:hypothetical protein
MAYPSAPNQLINYKLTRLRPSSPGMEDEAKRDVRDMVTVAAVAVAVGQDTAVVMVAKPTHTASGKATTKRWPSFQMVWKCITESERCSASPVGEIKPIHLDFTLSGLQLPIPSVFLLTTPSGQSLEDHPRPGEAETLQLPLGLFPQSELAQFLLARSAHALGPSLLSTRQVPKTASLRHSSPTLKRF